MPTVSVLMSVYNGRPHLEDAVESILQQTFEQFEFIIIDDGSTDGSTELLRRYAERDARIRLISQENRGLTRSLNTGLSIARGRYIARMDADDISLPDRLQRQVRYLNEHSDCVALGGQVVLIDSSGERVRHSARLPVDPETGRVERLWTEHASIDRELLKGRWPLVHPASTMRRDAVLSVGGYDDRYPRVQDHDLFLKLAEIGTLANLPMVVLHYRHHDAQVTSRVTDQNYMLRIIRREGYRRRDRDLPSELRFPALVRSWIGKQLRKTPFWPAALRLYNEIRR